MITEWITTVKLVKRGTHKVGINVPLEAVRQMELKAGENVRITIQKIETEG